MKYIKGERIWCVSNIQSQVGRPAPVKDLRQLKLYVLFVVYRLSFLVFRKTNNEQQK